MTVRDDLVEQVARSLASHSYTDEQVNGIWPSFADEARAAILETLRGIREPSEAMCKAGEKVIYDWGRCPPEDCIYQAMLDQLIKEIEKQ